MATAPALVHENDGLMDDLDLFVAGPEELDAQSGANAPQRDWAEVIQALATGQTDWDALSDIDKNALAYYDKNNVSRPTLLHRMAERWESGEFKGLSDETREKMVLFLLDQNLPHTDEQDDPILAVAMTYYRTALIDMIVENRPKAVLSLLRSTNKERRNCFHLAFMKTLTGAYKWQGGDQGHLAPTMATITKLLQHTDLAPIIEKDKLGNTPIHYAMDYRLCQIPGKHVYEGREYQYEGIINSLLLLLAKDPSALTNGELLFNNKHHSPYYHYFYIKSEVEKRLKDVAQSYAAAIKGLKPNEKEDTKAGDHNPKHPPKGIVKEPFRRESTAAREEAKGYHDAVGTLLKATPDLHHPPGQSISPATVDPEDIEFETTRPPLALRRTAQSNAIRDDTPPKVVPDAPKPGLQANAAVTKPGGNAKPFSWPGDKEKEASASILRLVKCFFIRNSTDRNAKDILYGKVASDRNLFFDASHLRGRGVDDVVNLIEKVSQAGGFEETLSYVRIPSLASATKVVAQPQRPNIANERRPIRKSVKAEPKGRDNLVKVFDKLVEVNVRRILRLHVEDNADEWAHTDSAIERAIKGYDQNGSGNPRDALEVEEWDWCKPDFNLDVIKYVAPSVEHLHLHWSGNQAVLYGWASSENGIPLMRLSPKSLLSKITLHAYRGLEDTRRRDSMAAHFRGLVEERTKGTVQVALQLLPRSLVISERSDREQDPFSGAQFEKPRSDAWVDAMERFRNALMGMHSGGQLANAQRVRVALIDDGIDLDEFNTYDKARYTGVSYYSGSGHVEDAWWKSTNGHGTIMANMISRINPWVDLEVIKIQSSPSYIHGDGAGSISPRSAADAINAAVVRGADIISMSWTIMDLGYRKYFIPDSGIADTVQGNKTHADEADLNLLRGAIQRAVKDEKHLLLCSAADDVRLNGENTLPYSVAPEKMLRIGSAGPFANRDQASGSGVAITYYLPGNQVAEEQRPHSAKPVVYHNGSSVSTALAAGLASLIMYCAHCLHALRPNDQYEYCASILRSQANMRKAFASINRYLEWKDDDKIVPVWGIFGDKANELEKATAEQKITVLKDLVNYLCQDAMSKRLVPG